MTAVWLIEDNSTYREVLAQELSSSSSDLSVRAFDRCEKALAVIEAGELPDVVLLDVGLPGMDGIKGIQRIKALHQKISIVMLTVFEDDDKIFRAVCAGACGYLLKSEPTDKIRAAIDEAMNGGSPMNPRVARRVLEMLSNVAPQRRDYGLSGRENEVLQAMVAGHPAKQISSDLNISLHTVNYYIRRIYEKLQVNCVASAVSLAVKERIVSG